MELMIDTPWLAGALIEMGFDPNEVKRDVRKCLWYLHCGDIFHVSDAKEMFAAEKVIDDLYVLYRDVVKREPLVLDPIGYCCWGPYLFNSLNYDLMKIHLAHWIGEHPESKKNAERVDERRIKPFRS